MFCEKCGKSLEEKDTVCPICGANQTKPLFKNSDYEKIVEKVSNESVGKVDAASLVLGILSIVFSAINYFGVPVVHLIGLTLGIIAITRTAKKLKLKIKLALGGFVTGIVGTGLGGVATVIGFIYGILQAV